MDPSENAVPLMCKRNCAYNPVRAYYLIGDKNNNCHLIEHYLLDTGKGLVDNTPFKDGRKYNNCIITDKLFGKHYVYSSNSVINIPVMTNNFYVYALIDPRNNQPFYVGKGADNRALYHYTEKSLKLESNSRKRAKIKKLNRLGFKPFIEYLEENIEDESLAYNIQERYISKFLIAEYNNDRLSDV